MERFLAYRLSRKCILGLEVALLCFGLYFLLKYHTPEHGLTRFLCFGADHLEKCSEEIQALPVLVRDEGYDGQLYFQIALDPTLSEAELTQGVNNLTYRARRILLPALAYGTGLGKPGWILYTFPLLNFCFWALLVYTLFHVLRIETVQGCLCALAIILTSGCIESIRLALVDLPASALALLAISLSRWRKSLFALSLLTRETGALSLFYYLPKQLSKESVLKTAGILALCVAPLFVWSAYLELSLGQGGGDTVKTVSDSGKFSAPFVSIVERIGMGIEDLKERFSVKHLFHLLVIGSLSLQAAYLLLRWKRDNDYWRWSVFFAVLFCFLGPLVWLDPRAVVRVILPMTFGFNLILMSQKNPRAFLPLFVLGNGGCLFGLYEVIFWA